MNSDSKFFISSELHKIMLDHANSDYPLEACGLIGGIGHIAHLLIPTKNVMQSETRYQIDPKEQLSAFHQFEDQNLELIAVYHSHPHGPARPSQTDIEEWNYPNCLSLIWSKYQNNWSCKGFIIMEDSYQEIPIEIKKLNSDSVL